MTGAGLAKLAAFAIVLTGADFVLYGSTGSAEVGTLPCFRIYLATVTIVAGRTGASSTEAGKNKNKHKRERELFDRHWSVITHVVISQEPTKDGP